MEANNQSRVLAYSMAKDIPEEQLAEISGGNSGLLSRVLTLKVGEPGRLPHPDVVFD